MKKFILIVIATVFTASLAACNTASPADDVIRIHIRANSNSAEDQAVKTEVVKEVTDYLTPVLAECDSKAEAIEAIKSNLREIERTADNKLVECGKMYASTAKAVREEFPARQYGGYVFDRGEYDALIIELGSGEGDNWWCVAFPPLCFVPSGDGENFRYKSKIVEIIEKFFKEER